MPPPPELGDAAGDIGIAEVRGKLKAQHPAKAGGHIGIAGEVEVNLEREGDDAQPGPGHRELVQGEGLIPLPQQPHVVGQQDLFPHAHHEDLHAGGELLRRAVPLVDLVPQVLVFQNGTGDELGKQGDKGAEVDDGVLGPGISAVYVDGIAHGLEGVKGDADGQMDVQHRHKSQAHGLERPGQKVPVLEEEQQPQVKDHGRGHRHPGPPVVAPGLAPLHQHPVGIVDGSGQQHNDGVDPLAPEVEQQGGAQQHRIAQTPGDQIVDQQSQCEKIKQENGS